jgi:hypothetical protein
MGKEGKDINKKRKAHTLLNFFTKITKVTTTLCSLTFWAKGDYKKNAIFSKKNTILFQKKNSYLKKNTF